MGECKRMSLWAKVKNIEQVYKRSDHVINELTDQIIIKFWLTSEWESEEATKEGTNFKNGGSRDYSEVIASSSTSTMSYVIVGVKLL